MLVNKTNRCNRFLNRCNPASTIYAGYKPSGEIIFESVKSQIIIGEIILQSV